MGERLRLRNLGRAKSTGPSLKQREEIRKYCESLSEEERNSEHLAENLMQFIRAKLVELFASNQTGSKNGFSQLERRTYSLIVPVVTGAIRSEGLEDTNVAIFLREEIRKYCESLSEEERNSEHLAENLMQFIRAKLVELFASNQTGSKNGFSQLEL
ncbi:hypothetical protein RHGRI_015931 [Rhododendron griersonianum]|uniref:Uncharacterized protein n=1 Tax=Rhododendron griersonianum TaxID=479676 RepID=A0AAV6JTD2_9ERIC|nr:hypothetical protein RHGRI_015931 [Rhododendron griersonianum]